jgi:hypothetical protein
MNTGDVNNKYYIKGFSGLIEYLLTKQENCDY